MSLYNLTSFADGMTITEANSSSVRALTLNTEIQTDEWGQYSTPLPGDVVGGNNYYYAPKATNTDVGSPLLYAHNGGYRRDLEDWYNFNRWYMVNYAEEELSGRHYVFFCRPDLYLVDETLNGNSAAWQNGWYESHQLSFPLSIESRAYEDPVFRYLYNIHPEIIESLTAEFSGNSVLSVANQIGNSRVTDGSKTKNGTTLGIHNFIPILSGRCESLQIPDYTLKTFSLTQPYTRYTLPFGIRTIESVTGGTFDASFKEVKDYKLSKLFYAWIYYIDAVTSNRMRPKLKYLRYNALDYATSVYDIMVDATGETILWWGKYTGAFPTSAPLSDLSWNKSGDSQSLTISIPFSYFMFEALNPEILVDFNYNSLGYDFMDNIDDGSGAGNTTQLHYMANYDPKLLNSGTSMVGRPYVEQIKRYNKLFYK